MKRLILAEILLLFLATTFQSDSTGGWVQQSIPIGNKTITDLQFLDSLNGWVVTDAGPSFDTAYIFKTSDGGNSWSFQSRYSATFRAICMVNYTTGYVCGQNGPGRIFKTINGGLNWNLISTLGESFTDIFFVNPNTGWVCDNDGTFGTGIIKTTDGGSTWQQQAPASYKPQKLFFINKDTGWAISNEANGKLYRTTNSGINWMQQFGFPTGLGNLFFVNKNTGFISGNFVPNAIRITTDGGFGWFPTSNSQGAIDIYFVNSSVGYACANFSTVQKTFDGGLNWYRLTVPTGDYISIQFADSLAGWAGGTKLIKTTDGGGLPIGIIKTNNEVKDFSLKQNYPNPFNPTTLIFFDLPEDSRIDLIIYNILGEETVKIFSNEFFTAGTVQYGFNASEENLSSGVYFYRLTIKPENKSNIYVDTKKMVYLK